MIDISPWWVNRTRLTNLAFIFTTIQVQDYALLIGSIGVFVILAFVMYFSRKIDWYNIKIGKDEEEIEEEINS